jgi:hypothetical protein
VVDGYGSESGAYELTMDYVVPPPPPPGCPPTGSIVTQIPTLSTESWSFNTSDIDSPGPYKAYDNIGVYGDITEIHFFGLDLHYDAGWFECDQVDPAMFEIAFYPDVVGRPGVAYQTLDVTATAVAVRDFSGYQQKEYVATLGSPVAIVPGWISIQGTETGDNCWFLWQNSFGGDNLALQFDGASYTVLAFDFSLCLIGTETSPWLTIDSEAGSIDPGGQPNTINVTMDASGLADGTYLGAINFASNDPQHPTMSVPVTFRIGGPICHYVVGDANHSGVFNGIDVTYSVGYFKGGPPPPYSCDCPPHGMFYAEGDVNGSCVFNGIDVTYMVSYFKGGPLPIPCPDCPPVILAAPGSPEIPSIQPILKSRVEPNVGGSQQ